MLLNKDQLDASNEAADQKNKKIIDVIDPTPVLFIDNKLNANDQISKNTTDNVFNLLPQVKQQTDDFFIDDDEFDEYKKAEAISIKQPSTDDWNDFVIILDNEKAEISKSLLKKGIKIKGNFKCKKQKNRKPYRKLIKKRQFTRCSWCSFSWHTNR